MLNYQSQMHLKLFQKKKEIPKAAEGIGNLIGNKIPDENTKVSKTLPQTVESETEINQ